MAGAIALRMQYACIMVRQCLVWLCRSLALRGKPELQDAGDEEGRQLIGTGSPVTSRGRHEFKALLQAHIPAAEHHLYFTHSSKMPNVLLYKAADLPGVGTVNARSYGRAISRVSFYVLISTEVGRPGQRSRQHLVAEVHNFCRVSPRHDGSAGPAKRFATCTVYRSQPSLCEGDLLVADTKQIMQKERLVPLEDIHNVLVSAVPSVVAVWHNSRRVRRKHFYPHDQGKIFLAVASSFSRST